MCLLSPTRCRRRSRPLTLTLLSVSVSTSKSTSMTICKARSVPGLAKSPLFKTSTQLSCRHWEASDLQWLHGFNLIHAPKWIFVCSRTNHVQSRSTLQIAVNRSPGACKSPRPVSFADEHRFDLDSLSIAVLVVSSNLLQASICTVSNCSSSRARLTPLTV